MVLTNIELWQNATSCFAKYHLDNGGTITDYETCGSMVQYTIDASSQLMTITTWSYSTTQPAVASLKSTYSVSDFATINHYFEDIDALKNPGVLSTDDRVFLTDYATQGDMVYDTTVSKLYFFNGTIWKEVSLL